MLTRNRLRRLRKNPAFTLIELLFVVAILAIIIAILLPSLSRSRNRAMQSQLNAPSSDYEAITAATAESSQLAATAKRSSTSPPSLPLANVTTFDAKITLIPTLSIGTSQAESIYQATFNGKISARLANSTPIRPDPAALEPNPANAEIQFPLPPQIISLADVSCKINGEPSDSIRLENGKLVWRGPLTNQPVPIELTYTAMGKGVFALDIPPSEKLETFNIDLTTKGSDIRMLELSLQPTENFTSAGMTTYKWSYRNLTFGRPIALDVLGIAPIDRLGELSWLGPLSIVLFGLIVGLFARAYDIANFDRWMLILVIGTFTGAYPLMYFAQEFTYPTLAIFLSAALVITIIAIRAITIMGPRLALLGTILPAAATMSLALVAALDTRLQGILLTIGGLAFFILAMILAPKLKALLPNLKTYGTFQPNPTPNPA